LARVLEIDAADPNGAQRAVEAAIGDEPQDADSLAELERLAESNRAWQAAADALARSLEAQERAAKLSSTPNLPLAGTPGAPSLGYGGVVAGATAGELWARLGRWRRDRVEDYRGAEMAFLHALDLDPENVELVRSVEELTRAPGRERDRIAVLR